MIELEPNPHLRLKRARKAAGLDLAELAGRLDLDPEEAAGLEEDPDALVYNLALGQLIQMFHVLAIDPRQLFAKDPAQPVAPAALEELLGQARAYMARHELGPDDFAEIVGLEPEEFQAFLASPVEIHAWSLSALQDLCDTLGLEWLAVLIALHAHA